MLALVVVSLLGQATPTPEERISRARAELRAGDTDAALIELCEGVADHPEAAALRFFRAGVCEALADDCPARMSVDRANADALDPQQKIRDWSGRWLFDAITGTFDDPSLEDLTYTARKLQAQLYWGNPLVETHQRALERVPTNELEHGYRLTNALLVEAGEVALQEAEALLRDAPDDPLLHLARGLALVTLARFDEASAELECTLGLGFMDPFVLDRLALLHARTGTFERALTALDEALRLAPESGYVRWHRIALRACRGEWSAALEEAEELAAQREEWEYEYARLCDALRARAADAPAEPSIGRHLDLGLAPYEDVKDLSGGDFRDETEPVDLLEELVGLPEREEVELYGALARILRARTDALEEPDATSGPLLEVRRALERHNGPRALVLLDGWLAAHPEDARAWRWRAHALEAFMMSLRTVSNRDELDGMRADPGQSTWATLGASLVRRRVVRTLEGEGFAPYLEQEGADDAEALALEIERLVLGQKNEGGRADRWLARLRHIVPADARELDWQRAGLLWEGSRTSARTYEEELRARDKTVATLPQDGLAWAARGQLRLHLGRLEDAAADLARARELAADDARVLVLYGDLQQAQGDVESALASWARALELDASQGGARRRRIVFLRQRGELEGALAELEALKSLQAEEDDRALVASLLGELGAKMEPHLAVEALTAAIDAGGFDRNLLLRRGQKYLELGDTAKARADYSALLSAFGKDGDALGGIDRCTALEQGTTREEARRQRILASVIASPFDLRERLELRREEQDTEGMLADYQRGEELFPLDARLRLEHGKLLKELQRVDEAWAAFDRALALDPELREARLERLWILCYRGRDGAAIQEATLLIDADFGTLDVYWARAESAMALGNHELAIHDYHVLRNGGQDVRADLAEAYSQQGAANQRMGFYQSAATAYSRSIEEKESAQAYYNLAVCYGQDGFAREAFENENKARALGHKGPPVLVYEEMAAPCWACGGAGGSQSFDRDVYSGTSTTETTYDSYGNSSTRILSTSGGWETRRGEWIPCSTCKGRGGR